MTCNSYKCTLFFFIIIHHYTPPLFKLVLSLHQYIFMSLIVKTVFHLFSYTFKGWTSHICPGIKNCFLCYENYIRWCKCEQQKKKFKFIFSTVFFYQNSRKNIFKFIFSNVFPKTAEKKYLNLFSPTFFQKQEKKNI